MATDWPPNSTQRRDRVATCTIRGPSCRCCRPQPTRSSWSLLTMLVYHGTSSATMEPFDGVRRIRHGEDLSRSTHRTGSMLEETRRWGHRLDYWDSILT